MCELVGCAEQQQASAAQGGERESQGGGEAAAGQQPCGEKSGGQMDKRGSPQMKVAVPGAGLERRRVLNDEEGGRIEPDEGGEPGQAIMVPPIKVRDFSFTSLSDAV